LVVSRLAGGGTLSAANPTDTLDKRLGDFRLAALGLVEGGGSRLVVSRLAGGSMLSAANPTDTPDKRLVDFRLAALGRVEGGGS